MTRNLLWTAVAAFVTVGFVATSLGAIIAVANGDGLGVLIPIPLGALVSWWIIVGALRRTSWLAERDGGHRGRSGAI